ncbi:MAG: S46 family peptidase [Bacteroidaceae bacterium]|nr:S46 family peptidase [Bacteroidaceae bacterium]
MKRFYLFASLLLSAMIAKADEGMWTMYNLPQAVYDQMKLQGITMGYDELYNNDNALKNAVVSFCDYCTGVVVSDKGLLFTNHHCGFEHINKASTVEHDYMRDGFVAKSMKDEIKTEAFAKFLIKQEDVTDRINTPKFLAMSTKDKNEYVEKVRMEMQKQAQATDSTYSLEIDPFYEGNRWIASTYQTYHDVRLVFTAPKSLGKFGGDTDNWMWPRQTCDFSVFRIYADPKTGGPAAYSPDNVPLKPKRYSKVSLDGYQPGSFAMVMGYPGSTSRYISSYGIQQRRDIRNAAMIDCRKPVLDILGEKMSSDQALRIMYEEKAARTSNYYKNSIGMNKCIDSIGLIAQKQKYEKKVEEFVNRSGYLKGKLDLELLENTYQAMAPAFKAMTYYGECLRSNAAIDSTKDIATEKLICEAMIKKYKESIDEKYQPKSFEEADIKALYKKIADDVKDYRSRIREQEGYLTAAILRMEEELPHYSDANFTMRLTYGQVGEYLLAGKPSGYYTDSESIVEKMKKGNTIPDYYAQPEVMNVMSAKSFGRYTDKRTGKMQLCFLTNNDITGGNSGSPVFGDKGQLLGLAFDGNWDSLANDIFFDATLGRCICVDVRYMMYVMDKWGKAGWLIKELTK